jgi:RNA polymerase sigma-70 factor, ECF subfamily
VPAPCRHSTWAAPETRGRVGCRKVVPADDVISVTTVPDRGAELLGLYDQALPEVYGYLIARCTDRALAQDLTAETFLAAVAAPPDAPRTVGWLIGIARHKLADHWRWQARQQRLLESVAGAAAPDEDRWDAALDVLRAHEVLNGLAPQHRAALTLRYLDGLSVPETAAVLERTVHATETLLVRARRAFRHDYEGGSDD